MTVIKKMFFCFIILFFCIPKLYSQPSTGCAVIPLHGEVDFALASFAKRSVEDAKEAGAEIIVFDIDTFGGRVDSALEISKTITDLNSIKTIAYVSVKAISAGALIALSADAIVMKEATTIGDCAPISISDKGPTMLGEKFQSPLRAEFRKLAERNGYPVTLAESMVSQDIVVVKLIYKDGHFVYMSKLEYEEMLDEEKKDVYKTVTVVDEGDLLTIHSKEALDFGFSSLIVQNQDELFEFYGIDKDDILKIEFMWSEKFVRFMHKIAPFLIFIGLMSLFTEFKVPGFGLPGIVAIICFALVFGSNYVVGLASHTDIMIFLLGVILLLLEIFVIPGFGITGITGIILIFASFYLASQSFVIPRFPWEFTLARDWGIRFSLVMVMFFICSMALAKYLPKSPIGRKMFLQTSLSVEKGFVDTYKDYGFLLGGTGIALSILRPSGKAKFGDEILDVISDEGFIDKGKPITVIKVKGKKLFVQEIEQV